MRAHEIKTPIPQLDLRRLDAGEAQRAQFLAELRTAAHEVGFFYVTGHDVETRLLRDLLESAQRFFSLPDADKLVSKNNARPNAVKSAADGVFSKSFE